MAWQQPLFNIAFQAAKNLSTSQHQAVRLTTAAKVTTVTSATMPIVGILQNNPTSGMEANVMVVGVSKVKVGAACARGKAKVNAVATAYAGMIVTGTTNADSNYRVQVIEAGGQAHDIVTAIINFSG